MKITFSLPQINVVAKTVAEKILNDKKKVVCFYGEMGTGKTTFIQAMCRAWGVKTVMSSPTFSIINEYVATNNITIFHLDLYRLKDEEEAIAAGVEEVLFSGHLCLIEWPQIIENIFPENALKISLSLAPSNKRLLKII